MDRIGKTGASLSAAALLTIGATSDAQTIAWSKMAAEDLEAARALILENHPGAQAEVGDPTFQKQLVRGVEDARGIASRARTYGDYRATLLRFAASFDDPHIQSDSLVQAPRYWPGFSVGLSRDRWVVTMRTGEVAPISARRSCHATAGHRICWPPRGWLLSWRTGQSVRANCAPHPGY